MYNYENYTKVKEELERRRLDSIEAADARAELLRSQSEEIAEIDKELSGTGLLLFKTACSGGDIAPIKKRNQELVKKKRAAIVALGYPEDFAEVKYHCPDCSDTGYNEKGAVCHCLREELIRATIVSSGIGKLIERQSFENFDLNWYKDNPDAYARMAANLSVAKSYVKNFPKKKDNLLLIGKTGTGKTHVSTAIAREIISMGYDVVYDSTHNIITDFEADKFRSGYGAGYQPKSEKYLECDLLIIDDLGTEFSSQFTVSCLYNLLNTRLNRGLATIISTNLSADELARKYEDRIYSRIVGTDSRVLVFVGRDHRLNA
ncbi:MAG: ATP-binding protein [Clostridia bacterium]|nr:ATP-binding protein [Clostridia bacterium]